MKMYTHPLSLQAVKVLRTAEFVPYVVFIEAPDYETLRAMNRAALDSGVSTKQLTVRGLELLGRGCWWPRVVGFKRGRISGSDLYVWKGRVVRTQCPESQMEPGTQN